MAEKSDKFAEVKKLLDSIQQDVAGGEYVYRGVSQIYTLDDDSTIDEERINSSIFRQYDKNIDFGKYQPANDENEIIEDVRPYFPPHSSNIEILSDLRHFGGDTAIIDFSRDLFVALFFACNGELDKEGELIAFPTAKTQSPSDDYFHGKSNEKEYIPEEISLINPVQTQTNKARVIAQKSVFIHVPQGFISPDLCTIISIESKMKKQILDYIKRFHDIDERTIYPDLHGFIAAQKRFALLRKHFYAGNALLRQEKYKDAVEEYDEVNRIKPNIAEAYYNRGIAKVKLNKPKEAIVDFDEVIRIKPNFAEAYYNRGAEKAFSNELEEAIEDFNEAIRLKPDYAEAHLYRGIAKAEPNRLEEAIADFDESIRIKPDYAFAYYNRGLVKVESNRLEEAIADFTEAIRLDPDDFDIYHCRGETWQKLGNKEKAQADFDKEEELASKQLEEENN